jgi:hypothetical protein
MTAAIDTEHLYGVLQRGARDGIRGVRLRERQRFEQMLNESRA